MFWRRLTLMTNKNGHIFNSRASYKIRIHSLISRWRLQSRSNAGGNSAVKAFWAHTVTSQRKKHPHIQWAAPRKASILNILKCLQSTYKETACWKTPVRGELVDVCTRTREAKFSPWHVLWWHSPFYGQVQRKNEHSRVWSRIISQLNNNPRFEN